MAVAERTRERVEERLSALGDRYRSFPVNQTTLSVAGAAYERARERCEGGLVDAYVQVYDEADDVLLVRSDDEWAVPRVVPSSEEPLGDGARRALRSATGVDCAVTDLRRATILGVRDEADPDRDPVYRLVAVFAAEYLDGVPGDDAAWHSDVPDAALPDY